MIVVFLGPPGSGKGTQAKFLSKKKSWPQLSTGDMLRNAINQGTKLGLLAKSFMDRGELVTDEVVVGLIAERVLNPDCKDGFILDGFPRTISQAESLEKILKQHSLKMDHVVLFEVDHDQIVSRLSGRRTCPKCQSVYHLTSSPPKKPGLCDNCDHSSLILRDDDKESVVRHRLEVYEKQTAPLIAYYEKKKMLERIDASQPVPAVQKKIMKIVES